MTLDIRWNKLAKDELVDAVSFLNEESAGLGEELLQEVGKALNLILIFPEMHPHIYKDKRRCITNRFTYGIIYEVNPDDIHILSVMHLRQEPFYWIDRLND